MFKAINTKKIHDININSNSLQVLHMSWFSNMTRLQYLKVSYNKISTIIPHRISRISKLYEDGNDITKFPKFCINQSYCNSALPSLSLSNNKFEYIGRLRSFPKLKILKIGDNFIGRIDNNTFTDLKMLTNLSLPAIGKQLKKIEGGALNMPSLQMLSLRYCNFHFDSLSVSEQSSLLSSCNYLNHLDLGGHLLQSTILPRIISSLKQFRYLNLENTRLGYLPANVFPELSVMNTLIMRKNRIYG